MISYVQPNQVDAVFAQLEPMIGKGLTVGQADSTTPEHFLAEIRRGDAQLWVVHEGEEIKAGIVTAVRVYPTGRKVYVDLLVGRNMDEWVDELEQVLMDYRDLIGAMCVEASCRFGLAKKLGKRGWKRKAVIMEAPK